MRLWSLRQRAATTPQTRFLLSHGLDNGLSAMDAWNPHAGLAYRPPTTMPISMPSASSLVRTAKPLFAPDKGRFTLLVPNSAHARPIDIHQRPYPALPVCIPLSLVPGRITDFRSFLVDFFFLGGRGRVHHLDPMINRMPPRESISRFHSASVPQISILEYLRRIVRFTNVEVCPMLSPLSSLPFIPSPSPSRSSLKTNHETN